MPGNEGNDARTLLNPASFYIGSDSEDDVPQHAEPLTPPVVSFSRPAAFALRLRAVDVDPEIGGPGFSRVIPSPSAWSEQAQPCQPECVDQEDAVTHLCVVFEIRRDEATHLSTLVDGSLSQAMDLYMSDQLVAKQDAARILAHSPWVRAGTKAELPQHRRVEEQRAAHCGKHAINNVVGRELLSVAMLEQAVSDVMEGEESSVAHDIHGNASSGLWSGSALSAAVENTGQYTLRYLDQRALKAVPRSPMLVGFVLRPKDDQHWVAAYLEGADVMRVIDSRGPTGPVSYCVKGVSPILSVIHQCSVLLLERVILAPFVFDGPPPDEHASQDAETPKSQVLQVKLVATWAVQVQIACVLQIVQHQRSLRPHQSQHWFQRRTQQPTSTRQKSPLNHMLNLTRLNSRPMDHRSLRKILRNLCHTTIKIDVDVRVRVIAERAVVVIKTRSTHEMVRALSPRIRSVLDVRAGDGNLVEVVSGTSKFQTVNRRW